MQNGFHHELTNHEAKYHSAPGTIPVEDELPRRGKAPGMHMGLSVLMDVREEEYFCTGSESVGFKV